MPNLPNIMTFIKRNNLWFLLVFLYFVYILTLRGIPGNLLPNGKGASSITSNIPPFETSQERGRYAQIVSLVNYKTIYIDRYSDFVKPDLAWYNGHFISAFPPGIAFVAVPFFIWGQYLGLSQVFTYLTTVIFGILTCLIIYKICQELKMSSYSRAIAVLSYGIASVAWVYTVTLSAHTASAFLIASAFYLFLKIKPENKRNFFYLSFIWLIFGLNFFVDYPNLAILLPILLGSFIRMLKFKKDNGIASLKIPLTMIYASIFVILTIGLFVTYNLNVYGKPIAFTNRYNLKVLENAGIKTDKKYLNNDIFSQHKYSSRFTLNGLIKGAEVLTISKDRGLFFYSPIFFFSIFGFYLALRKKYIWPIIILLSFLTNIIIYGSFDDPWGGWAFGSRYLIPTIPFLAVLIGYAFDKKIHKSLFLKLIFSGLLIYSIGISLIGAITTNAVPPSIEAIYLNMPSNYVLNFKYLLTNGTSSFFYNYSLMHNYIQPWGFYLIIFCVVTVFAIILIWIPKHYDKN